MANTNLVKTKTRLELYLIGLAQSHMVFMTSLNLVQENPRQIFNMYSKHLRLTSSQHSLSSRAGINLVDNTQVHSSLKWTSCWSWKKLLMTAASPILMKVVKFLFLTHNQNSRIKDALLDKMKGISTLMECLTIAKTVESTIKTEKLSKTFLQNVNKPDSTEVDEINRSKGQNWNKSGGRGQRFNWSSSCKGGKGQGKCRNCGNNHPPRKCPAYGKECFRCKKPSHFKEFCRSNPQNRSQSQGGGARQTCKDMHEVDKEDDPFAMYEYGAINVRTVHSLPMSSNANIAFDEVSSDRKLQCLLTDVTVSNKMNKTNSSC